MRKLGSATRYVFAFALAACISDEAQQAFDDDDNDDDGQLIGDGKEDGTTSTAYRADCGTPIRTGSYALHGDVVTPTGVKTGYYLVVTDEKISAIQATKPTGMTVVETNGIIFPGLVDGHGHVEYNHIPIADLGKRYQDRDQWPNADLYQTLVKDPKNAVTAAGLQCEAVKHGEARALVGGTTAIQGSPQLSCARSMVRNLEAVNFCAKRERQNVMDISGFGRSISGKLSFADSVKAQIAAKQLDAVVVHAGEGIDAHELAEWGQLKSLGLNVPQLVMIHTTAFGEPEYREIGAVGAKVIWSPLSNLLLYGKTADIPTALKYNVNVSLGSDWAPSGSPNLLAELKVADHVNHELWNAVITDQQLFNMVTINPAKAYAIDKFVGTLEVGKYADIMVIAKPATSVTAYRALIDAQPQDVQLVTISGDPLFGTTAAMTALGKSGDYEVIDACGSPRAIDVTVDATTGLSKGTETLATIESQLKTVNPKLTPIIDCTNDAALAAYKGIPELQ
jgi:cytosine/adenosine deaminase-related metal-dependent hydrolase